MDNLDYLSFYFIGITLIFLFFKWFNIKKWFTPEFVQAYFNNLLQPDSDENDIKKHESKLIVEKNVAKTTKNVRKFAIICFIFIFIITLSVLTSHIIAYNGLTQGTAFGYAVACGMPCFMILFIYIYVNIMFPGLKNIFANVFGYFTIYVSTNNIIADILNDVGIDYYSSTLTKLLQNEFVLINRLSPTNFYEVLSTFIKEQKPKDIGKIPMEKIEILYNSIFIKDYIGEFFWLLYTCIFVATLVAFYASLIHK
jgi:hypothetical protein